MGNRHRTPTLAIALTLATIALMTLPQVASSAFSRTSASGTAAAGTDYLTKHFAIVPGTAVQPGTSTSIASGSGATIALDLGRVPDSRTIPDVLRVTNTDAVARSFTMSLIGTLTGIAGLQFSDGTTTKSIAPGATWQVRVVTNAGAAGPFNGTARFQLTGDSFLLKNRPIQTAQAPLAATALTIAPPDGTAHASLSWTASASTGVAGYNVYRATAVGGPFAKVNATPVVGTAYDDTGVVAGGTYWYSVRAVAAGVAPDLESPASNVVQTAVVMSPTSVSIPAGASNNVNWVTLATRGAVTFQVAVPAGTRVGDVVHLSVTSGAKSLTLTQNAVGGAQTLSFAGNNLTTWADGALGSISLDAWVTRGAFATPQLAGNAGKDTVVPAAPTGANVPAGAQNPANYVNMFTYTAAPVAVTSSAAATDTVQAQLTSAGVPAIGTATGGTNPATVLVNTSALTDTAVGGLTVQARVVDQAGNPSAWHTGTAATKDTVAPVPNFNNIRFTQNVFIFWVLSTYVTGNNGAVGAGNQVFVVDNDDNSTDGWLTANGNGNFGRVTLSNTRRPIIVGYDVRDTAWNQNPRYCREYNGNGIGTAVGCP